MTVNDAKLEFAAKPDRRERTTALILHHAAGDGGAEAIHKAHLARGWYGIGYHYYICKDGSIWRGRPEDSVGAHTYGMNAVSIGICFEGNFEKEEMPALQLAAGKRLIADILARYPGIIIGRHRDYDATACPGKNFPQELLSPESSCCAELIAQLTDEQAYAILEKARRHAAAMPLPAWAQTEYDEAVAAGITDGETPMALMPRWQGAVMALRSRK